MSAKSFKIPGHWWGKIIGGVIGLFRGGLTGALIGALLGHLVDRFLAGIIGVGATQKAFFDALFGSLGHLAKADGRVTETEIRMVESLMQQMRISGEDRQRAIRLFNQGKQPGFDLRGGAASLRAAFRGAPGPAPDVHANHGRGRVLQRQPSPRRSTPCCCGWPARCGFRSSCSARCCRRGAGVGAGGRYQAGAGAGGAAGQSLASLDQAYAQLGLTRKASDAEIKKAYRKLVSQYHPDKLVSRGLPEEMMEMAKTRVRDINTAYDRIKQARGFK